MPTIDLENKLAGKQVTPTAMRLRVLDFLYGQDMAVSLSDVEKGLGHTDRVTVYRTLKTFEEHCLIHGIDDGTGTTKYALCADDCTPEGRHSDLHAHFYCKECDTTTCLSATGIPSLQLPQGYIPEEMNLTVKGTCKHCSPAGKGSSTINT
jgi:Fur family ferric uptake transcriptional regulator